MNKCRFPTYKTKGVPASDGDGVRLTRIIGSHFIDDLDPFLMLDRFETDNPSDYIGGFPPHPHRGFETVTYLIAGKMRHSDNRGHHGIIEDGGVQWMTAGKGIIHSEMPEQTDGLLKGFQLWVNLPASQKMVEPSYQEFSEKYIPTEDHEHYRVKVITGKTTQNTVGPVVNQYIQPLMLDITLEHQAVFRESLKFDDQAFVMVISGSIEFNDGTQHSEAPNYVIHAEELAVLSEGDVVEFTALEENTQVLLVIAQKINEPVVKGGPFVMNTEQEIQQAFSDYRYGKF
jgi:redox-sensitive bicupin YhaK (pirin superfamily)